MKKNNGSPVTFYTMGVAVLFLAGFFLLAIFGARAYCRVAEGQEKNNESRALLSYLSTCVKSGDGAGRVTVRQGMGDISSPVLEVADGSSGYAIRIYQEGGRLLEEYGSREQEPNPSMAQEIGKTEVFQVEELAEGTFAVTTDAGRALFSVRSEGTAEAADEQ